MQTAMNTNEQELRVGIDYGKDGGDNTAITVIENGEIVCSIDAPSRYLEAIFQSREREAEKRGYGMAANTYLLSGEKERTEKAVNEAVEKFSERILEEAFRCGHSSNPTDYIKWVSDLPNLVASLTGEKGKDE